jgi:hypothetical protein
LDPGTDVGNGGVGILFGEAAVIRFVREVVSIYLKKIFRSFHYGWAKIFVSWNDNPPFGLAKHAKEILLLRK